MIVSLFNNRSIGLWRKATKNVMDGPLMLTRNITVDGMNCGFSGHNSALSPTALTEMIFPVGNRLAAMPALLCFSVVSDGECQMPADGEAQSAWLLNIWVKRHDWPMGVGHSQIVPRQ
jgi:hypothetical protein